MYTYTYYSTVHGVLKARMMKWFVVPFSSGAHFVRTLHVALHGVLHSFIDSDKAVAHVISLISFLWLRFSFCLPSDGEGLRGLWKLPDGRDWLWEKQIKLPTSIRSLKKQESSRKTSISALLTMPKPLTVWLKTNYGKFFKRWEYQNTWSASWEICRQVKKQQ